MKESSSSSSSSSPALPSSHRYNNNTHHHHHQYQQHQYNQQPTVIFKMLQLPSSSPSSPPSPSSPSSPSSASSSSAVTSFTGGATVYVSTTSTTNASDNGGDTASDSKRNERRPRSLNELRHNTTNISAVTGAQSSSSSSSSKTVSSEKNNSHVVTIHISQGNKQHQSSGAGINLNGLEKYHQPSTTVVATKSNRFIDESHHHHQKQQKQQQQEKRGTISVVPIIQDTKVTLSQHQLRPSRTAAVGDEIKKTSEMVQKNNNASDLDVNNSSYLYFMMTSGQCSPSDTLDSGTCSDLEVTPPPLPKKLSPKGKSLNGQQQQLHVTENNEDRHHQRHHQHQHHHNQFNNKQTVRHVRNGSITDSEESESSLSCDSLNCGEFSSTLASLDNDGLAVINNVMKSSIITTTTTTNGNGILPDSLLKDIRNRSNVQKSHHLQSPQLVQHQTAAPAKKLIDFSITSLEDSLQENRQNKENELNKIFENDKFYHFHINEYQRDDKILSSTTDGGFAGGRRSCEDDESFAGYRDISSGTSTIRSSKGTIRGVKNRVRNGIATFLQMQQTNVKNFKEKDAGKVVLYTTSMGIVRETYAKCANVKQILRTLLVKFEERDVFMSCDYQQEIKDRMQQDEIDVPQLFVDGQYIGDAEIVERLNETGELRKMLKPYKCLDPSYTCQMCGGYRLLPCPSCSGSKKSVHRNHFTAEFVALKCMNCDEVGLVKCHNC